MTSDLPPELRTIEDRLRARSRPGLPTRLRDRVLADATRRHRAGATLGRWFLLAAGLLLAINAITVLAGRTGTRPTAQTMPTDLDRRITDLHALLPDCDPALLRRGLALTLLPTAAPAIPLLAENQP